MPYFEELKKRLAGSLQDPNFAQATPGSLVTAPQEAPQATDLQSLLAEKQAAQQDATLGRTREANMNEALQPPQAPPITLADLLERLRSANK